VEPLGPSRSGVTARGISSEEGEGMSSGGGVRSRRLGDAVGMAIGLSERFVRQQEQSQATQYALQLNFFQLKPLI
jgi:hypothetical protein